MTIFIYFLKLTPMPYRVELNRLFLPWVEPTVIHIFARRAKPFLLQKIQVNNIDPIL
jgi:hypothetical protein